MVIRSSDIVAEWRTLQIPSGMQGSFIKYNKTTRAPAGNRSAASTIRNRQKHPFLQGMFIFVTANKLDLLCVCTHICRLSSQFSAFTKNGLYVNNVMTQELYEQKISLIYREYLPYLANIILWRRRLVTCVREWI